MTGFRRLFSNTAYLAGTNGLSMGVALIFAILSTRYYSTSGFGNLVAVLSLTTFMEGILRGSVNMVLTQRVAQKSERAGEYLVPALWLYFWGGMLFMAVGAGIEWFLTHSALLVWAVVLSSLITIVRLIGDAAVSILRGFEQMGQEFWTTFVERVAFLLLFWAVIVSPLPRETAGFLAVFAINIVTQFLQSMILIVPLWRKLRPRLHVNRDCFNDLIRASRPLWLCAGIILLNGRVDLFIIQWLSGDQQLGVFASAFKIMDMVRISPWIICMAIYPSLSRYAKEAPENFDTIYASAMKLILLLAVPITLFTYFLAGPLVVILFTEKYVTAVTLLKWMALSVLPMFHNTLFSYGILAREKQSQLAYIYGSALLLHTLAGFLLIPGPGPVGGAVGGALSYFVGEMALMIIGLVVSTKMISPSSAKSTVRPLLCILLTGATLILLYRTSMTAALIVSSIVFLASIRLSRVFTREELRQVRSIYGKPAPALSDETGTSEQDTREEALVHQ
ncbi:MAG: flippase [Armatimonadetes bacterium]|nr:flippase [Armatimonadota bacterium]